jgi:hypothetical protein
MFGQQGERERSSGGLTACAASWRWPDEFAGRRLNVAARELCT